MDFSFAEIALIVVVAVVFIGPKELPVVVKAVAKAMRALKGLTADIRKAFDEVAKESGFEDIEKEVRMIKGEDGQYYEAYDTTKIPQMSVGEEFEQQPLLEHLIEFRNRTMRCMILFFAATAVSYFFAADIYSFLVRPLAEAFPNPEHRRLIYTGLTEAFMAYLKLATFAGFLISFPYIASQLYLFLAPGLYKGERKMLLPYLVAAPILFISGAAFAYYVIFPAAWHFFLGFETPGAPGSLPIQLETRVMDYLNLVMHLIIAFGLCFQLPVVLVLLVRSGLMQLSTLKKGRRYAIVIIVAVAAVVTPPDIFSQIALSVPLYLLYEISILLCRNVGENNARHQVDTPEPGSV